VNTQTGPDTRPAARPRSVDLAVGAILLRCVLALAAALALFGAKDELRRDAAKLHPEWSAATLTDKIDSGLRSNVVLTLVYIGLVLLIAKFVRDGRNWARWLFVFVALLVAGDVLRVAGFFTGENLLFRALSGLTGLAAVAAIVLLFSPTSNAYFRPAGPGSPLLRGLFAGRALGPRPAAGEPVVPQDAPPRGTSSGGVSSDGVSSGGVSLDKASPATGTAPAGRSSGTRPAPRAKSRRQAAE
jgi:hypothetical protein